MVLSQRHLPRPLSFLASHAMNNGLNIKPDIAARGSTFCNAIYMYNVDKRLRSLNEEPRIVNGLRYESDQDLLLL